MATNPRHDVDDMARAARATAQAGEQAARAGAETMQRATESVEDAWHSGGEIASRMAKRSADQFSMIFGVGGEAAQQSIRRSSGTLQAVMESTSTIAGSLQSVSGEWMHFAQTRVERNLDGMDALLRCRSIPECVARQTELARENLEAFLQSTRRTSEMVQRMADEAMQRLSHSAEASLVPR